MLALALSSALTLDLKREPAQLAFLISLPIPLQARRGLSSSLPPQRVGRFVSSSSHLGHVEAAPGARALARILPAETPDSNSYLRMCLLSSPGEVFCRQKCSFRTPSVASDGAAQP